MKLLLALALAGFAGSTPTRVCRDECGRRIGCDFVAPEASKPAECPADPPPPERPQTVCVEGVRYFKRTLTPLLDPVGRPLGCKR